MCIQCYTGMQVYIPCTAGMCHRIFTQQFAGINVSPTGCIHFVVFGAAPQFNIRTTAYLCRYSRRIHIEFNTRSAAGMQIELIRF